MAAASFDYNQLSIVGRDESSIKFIQDALMKELKNLRDKADVNGANFKAVISTANTVWAGADKDAFVKNLTAFAQQYVNDIDTVRANVQKYLTNDVTDFKSMQSKSLNITSK